MFDPDSREEWRNRSLLSLGDPVGAPAPEREPNPRSSPPPDRPALEIQPDASAKEVTSAEERGVVAFVRRAAARLAAAFPPGKTEDDRPPAEEEHHDVLPQEEEPRTAGEEVYWKPLIDPMSIVAGIVRFRRLIVLSTVLGAVIGVMVALATPKYYYAATELLFDPRDLQLLDRDLTRGSLPSDATLALIENQVSIIRSGTVLQTVAERLNLANDPEFNGEGGGGILSKLMNPRALLSFGGGGPSNDALRASLAIQNLADSLDVDRNARTFIIHIGATTHDPDKSALIADTTAKAYLEISGDLQTGMARRANSEITGQLDELRAEVERAEQAVADFKAQNDIVDAQGRLITEDEMVRLNDQLSTARARTAELNARVAVARELDVDQVLGGALPEQVASPVMTELLAQYASLRQMVDRAAVRLGPRHPDYLAAQAELAGVRETISGELRRIAASMQIELRRAVELEQELAARLARLKVEKGGLENEQVKLRELEREAAARRSVYEAFLLRARETGQQLDLNTSNVAVISEARPPLLPSGPSRASIAVAGTVLGFLIGIGLGGAMGAIESLRANMASRRRRPVTQPRAASVSSRGDMGNDFDPPPAASETAGHRNAFSQHAPAAASAMGTPPPLRPEQVTAESLGGRPSHSYMPAPPPANDGVSTHPLPEMDEDPIDHIRLSLRAFREEIDALTERRARRRG